MNVRDRVQAVLNGRTPDRIPQLIYSGHLPRGSFERRMRNLGLGLDIRCRVHRTETPHVKTESKKVGTYSHIETSTPVGTLHSKRRVDMRFQLPGGSWLLEHPVKKEEDLEVVKFIVEDTAYEPYYEDYCQNYRELEGDGVVTVSSGYTPLMRIMIEFLGVKSFVLMYRRSPRAIEELVKVIDRKYLELYSIIAESPAEIVRIGDNTDEVIVPPALFERHCLPYFDKYCRVLRKSGKKVISHMDGRLKTLKELIALTELDAIEAFTPPPTGNLPLKEARAAWSGKAIWMNFPESVLLGSAESIRKHTMSILKEIAPGDGYIISITEDIHPEHYRKGLGTLTRTLCRHGSLPLTA